jgi:hypothetical protein
MVDIRVLNSFQQVDVLAARGMSLPYAVSHPISLLVGKLKLNLNKLWLLKHVTLGHAISTCGMLTGKSDFAARVKSDHTYKEGT